MTSSFAPEADAAFDQLVGSHLEAITAHVLRLLPAAELDCLVLGGGYGRGEGGVLGTGAQARPYNDYDLVLVHHVGDRRLLTHALAEVHREQTARCGVHVDVTPVRRERVARLPPALTWFELGRGYRLLWGGAEALAPLRARTLDGVHPTEWGRLLVNRSAGVVFARRVLHAEPCGVLGDEEPHAFAHRQLMKAWLALGDVWLADRGLYRPLVQERVRLFSQAIATGAPEWAERYRAAQRFKLAPTAAPDRQTLLADLARLTPLLADALAHRPAAIARATVGLYATLRLVPPHRWAQSLPWRYPRERLRLGLCAELRGDLHERDRVCGSASGFERLWSRYG